MSCGISLLICAFGIKLKRSKENIKKQCWPAILWFSEEVFWVPNVCYYAFHEDDVCFVSGNFDWEGVDVCAVTVPGDAEYATLHGVYKLSEEVCLKPMNHYIWDSFIQGLVKDIFYQGEKEQVDKCKMLNGQVPMVTNAKTFKAFDLHD